MKLLKPSGQLEVRWSKLPLLQAAVPKQLLEQLEFRKPPLPSSGLEAHKDSFHSWAASHRDHTTPEGLIPQLQLA